MTKRIIKRIYKVNDHDGNFICPPQRVFDNPNFIFLITIGGHLADNEKEYDKLMDLLKNLGEDRFYMVENSNSNASTNKSKPFQLMMPTTSCFKVFDGKVKSFNPPFGFIKSHFFIFGENPNWGIYMCEYPTINIIGCVPVLAEKFRGVFNIKNNGYSKLKAFINQEFKNKKELKDQLIKNYKLS